MPLGGGAANALTTMKTSSPMMSSPPTEAPTAMPAMAPLERPLEEEEDE